MNGTAGQHNEFVKFKCESLFELQPDILRNVSVGVIASWILVAVVSGLIVHLFDRRRLKKGLQAARDADEARKQEIDMSARLQAQLIDIQDNASLLKLQIKEANEEISQLKGLLKRGNVEAQSESSERRRAGAAGEAEGARLGSAVEVEEAKLDGSEQVAAPVRPAVRSGAAEKARSPGCRAAGKMKVSSVAEAENDDGSMIHRCSPAALCWPKSEGPNLRKATQGHLRIFRLKDIKKATDNFSQKNILGEGGCGIVYKGILPDGRIVAVKKLKHDSAIRDNEFQKEVEVISLAAHQHLLTLIGFCAESNEKLLIYPYMSSGSVASKLKEEPTLDWSSRKKIAIGASQGLVYLHDKFNPKIIHCDIKGSNILLNEDHEAFVADFGLAKLLGPDISHAFTQVRGTYGRIPPEYCYHYHISEKTDVYEFGFFLIELITASSSLDEGIIDVAKFCLEQKQLSCFVDKKLRNYDEVELDEMVRIALLCTMEDPNHRPRMAEVVVMLEGEGRIAERWKATMENVNKPNPHEPQQSEQQLNSMELQAIELSGPR